MEVNMASKQGSVTAQGKKVQWKVTKTGKAAGYPYRLYMRHGNRKWYGMTDVKSVPNKSKLKLYATNYLNWAGPMELASGK